MTESDEMATGPFLLAVSSFLPFFALWYTLTPGFGTRVDAAVGFQGAADVVTILLICWFLGAPVAGVLWDRH